MNKEEKELINKIKEKLENPTKKRIINHLNQNGSLNLGTIIKNLSLTPKSGTLHIIELKKTGIIQYVKGSSLLELNQNLFNLFFNSN